MGSAVCRRRRRSRRRERERGWRRFWIVLDPMLVTVLARLLLARHLFARLLLARLLFARLPERSVVCSIYS
jgi:hypothetical protein